MAWARAGMGVGIATAVLCVAVATASGAVRCVGVSSSECTTTHATVAAAVDAAADQDEIRIGQGTHPTSVDTPKILTFTGAGPGTSGGGATVLDGGLTLRRGGGLRELAVTGTLSADTEGVDPASLSLEDTNLQGISDGIFGGSPALVAGADPGVALAVTIRRSLIVGGDGGFLGPGAPGIDVRGDGTTLDAARSVFVGGDGGFAFQAVSFGGGTGVVNRSLLFGVNCAAAHSGELTIRRSLLDCQTIGFLVSAFEGEAHGVLDHVIARTRGGSATTASVDATDGHAELTALASTIVVRGDEARAAVAANERTGGESRIRVRSTVATAPARGVPDLLADGGIITASRSAFRHSNAGPDGSAPAPGSGTNVSGKPRLGADWIPRASSPLIDRGARDLTGRDIYGNRRSVDGDGDGRARPDIGAVERQRRRAARVARRALPDWLAGAARQYRR